MVPCWEFPNSNIQYFYHSHLFDFLDDQDGKFEVPIQAVLPQHNLVLPEHLHFGMCAAQDHVQLTFELNNTR